MTRFWTSSGTQIAPQAPEHVRLFMKNHDNVLKKWTPHVRKKWLYRVAGAMWSGVGLLLTSVALGWLWPLDWHIALVLAGTGVALGLLIYRFGFSKLATKNSRRIERFPKQKICLFAFQAWRSYPLVAVMMALGILLRSSAIPKSYLAILYLGLGLGLFLSSFQYYGRSLRQEEETGV